MRMERQQKEKKRTLWFIALALLLVLMPLCTVATYTWFALSRTPKVSDMEMTINSGVGFQIAWDRDEEAVWGQQLDFTDRVPTDTLLTPVTWSDKENRFYTTTFGADGRVADIDVALSDSMDANGRDGHYVKFTFYGRADEHVNVSLSPAVALEDGSKSAGTYLIGTPLWEEDRLAHGDGGAGAQYATRVGIRVTGLEADGSAKPAPVFYIYEPNCDGHVDGRTGYTATRSMDGGAGLVPEERLIRQTTSSWEESEPVQRDVVIRELGRFDGKTTLFDLEAGGTVMLEVYVWLEGMDVDCVNAIGQDARLFANLQFLAEPYQHSGLVPIT